MKKLIVIFLITLLPCISFGLEVEDSVTNPSGDMDMATFDINVSSINAKDGDGLSLLDDGNNLGVFVEDGGNVGLGTKSPTRKLEVNGDIESSDYICNNVNPTVKLEDSTAGDDDWRTRADADDYNLQQRVGDTAWTSRIFVEGDNGNIGVGTEVPTAKISVATTATSNYFFNIAGSFQTLPTSGYEEGTMVYQVSDHTVYISTETVTKTKSWKSVW